MFIAAPADPAAIELWLARRRLHPAAAHREAVPAPSAGDVLRADHRKAADYTRRWRTFVVEQRYGFNHTRALLFMTDLVRCTALPLLPGTPLVAAALLRRIARLALRI